MPIPNKRADEEQSDFMSRCMSDSKMREEYEYEQRLAVCMQAGKADEDEDEDEDEESASGTVFIYEDPKTGELYHYSRRGVYRKGGRVLRFVKISH